MSTRRLPLALVLTAFALAPSVHAGDVATAEALFREGRALMDAGNFQAACPKLAESYAQDPGTGTLLALAICQESAGQTATAWATFAMVVPRAKTDGRADREEAARTHMAALEPKLSHLTIVVDAANAGASGLVVTRDGTAVGSGAWGVAVPIDPGPHAIEATAPGKNPWKTTVTIGAEADAQSIQVPLLSEAPAAAPLNAAAPAPADTGVTSTSGFPLRTVGIITGAVGVVGLGLSGYFGLHAASLDSDSKKDGHCDAQQRCDATGGSLRGDAISAATAATVTLVVGGVLTATGVTLFFVGAPKDEGRRAHVEASPLVARDVGGLMVRGAF
jgi:hypothetical protein